MFGFSQPLAHLTVVFILDGKEYKVDGFKVGFSQEIDYKGQPQHETQGGQIYLKLDHAADNTLFEWAKESTMLKSGAILFKTELSSPVLQVEFDNAYCIGLTRSIHVKDGTKTSLIISPERIEINGIKHRNYWTN